MRQLFFLGFWFFRAKFFGVRKPLQTVIFINDNCNLACKHCSIYAREKPIIKNYEQIREELVYAYGLGSRFVDFEGGEPTLWRDGEHDLNSLLRLAKEIGFYSTTITTNAQRPFANNEADSIWVSLDGLGSYHDDIRGEGSSNKLTENIAAAGHPRLSVNMVINSRNYQSVAETIQFAKDNPHIHLISLNFHTPFPGTEDLFLDWERRGQTIDAIIDMKKKGYPIMNSVSGLKYMKTNDFAKRCWITNFIMVDGTRLDECQGKAAGICDRCGFSMAGEMRAVMALKPDTVLAGMRLRVS